MADAGFAVLDAPDEVLAAQADEDQAAFTELYKRYIDPIYRFMRYQAPTEEAQDLTAQVFFNAYRAASQFRGEGHSYRAWLFRIAHNTLSTWRRTSPRRPVPVPAVPEMAGGPDPERHVADGELRDALWGAVAELPPQDRELIAMRYVEGLPHAEIALVTGGSDGATRVRIHRLLRRLRGSLERRGVKP